MYSPLVRISPALCCVIGQGCGLLPSLYDRLGRGDRRPLSDLKLGFKQGPSGFVGIRPVLLSLDTPRHSGAE